MRACLGFLLAMAILQMAGFIAYANVGLDAVPGSTHPKSHELIGIQKILDVLAPVNVRKVDKGIEHSIQNHVDWREQLYQKQPSSPAKFQGQPPEKPRSPLQRAY